MAERLETERRLTAELARLAEPFRSTLMLRYYDSLEPTEIARSLGIPASTVRFESLTPGGWCLYAQVEEIVPGRTSNRISDAREPIELDWTCTVRAGETTTCDLALGDAEACVLQGRLSIDAAPPWPWQTWLAPEGEAFEFEPAVRMPLDPEGRFRLAAAEPGRYQLVLVNVLAGPEMQWVLDLVELRTGETTWERGLAAGTLRMAEAPEWDGEGAPAAVHVWQGEGELRALTVLAASAAGAPGAPSAPSALGALG